MNTRAYLRRINYDGPTTPGLETLRGLQRAHLFTVPFENLDIHLGRPINLDTQALFTKIVENGRGGFCYELNNLFAWLLGELGFRVTRLAARVLDAADEPGPEFDHLMLLVDLGDPLIADVGFGDASLYPLKLNDDEPQSDGRRAYRVTHQDRKWYILQQANDGGWKREIVFTLQPRAIEEFLATCHFHQTSPESPFTQRLVCSVATDAGRITLRGQWDDMKVIITNDGVKRETFLSDRDAVIQLLQEAFKIVL